MGLSQFFTLERMTGAALIASFISFAIGGTLPIVGEKGSARMFNLPVSEHLQAVAANALVWRWANVCMGAAAVILLAGLSMLTTLLEAADERFCSRLGLIGWLMATVLMPSCLRAPMIPPGSSAPQRPPRRAAHCQEDYHADQRRRPG